MIVRHRKQYTYISLKTLLQLNDAAKTDLMISDYSSTFFDYSILGKPMLCFAYDLEEYEEKRTPVAHTTTKTLGERFPIFAGCLHHIFHEYVHQMKGEDADEQPDNRTYYVAYRFDVESYFVWEHTPHA